MSVATSALPVDVCPRLSPEDFYAGYVNKKPLVMRGAISGLPAVSRWSVNYLASLAPDLQVRLKTGSLADGRTTTARLDDYCRTVTEWEERPAVPDSAEPPSYLHDLPLLRMIPRLMRDLEGFPTEFFPKFFHNRWWEFTQWFIGPSRAVTPLHFDSLLTHNLFFQIRGTKRFVMVHPGDRDRCYIRKWRWSPVDPDEPDTERYPRFRGARVLTCLVEPGDLLYMPPGTLHKVTSLTSSISFNIDWHDPRSALRSLIAAGDGMPARNLGYNLLFCLGVIGKVPPAVLMPALRSYFTYIS
ncbi:MAG TPA: cupin-like domain-containing protein [Streptosporangiaceae bacterium]|nr:cupin-like domain-containing protein [Streptosporangiaceae bacterium]